MEIDKQFLTAGAQERLRLVLSYVMGIICQW